MSSDGLIESLKKSAEERGQLIAMLEMWNKVQEQGIEPEDVARFALEEKFMTQRQCHEYQQLKYAKKVVTNEQGQRRAIPSHANAVRMKDGTTIELNPWVELP